MKVATNQLRKRGTCCSGEAENHIRESGWEGNLKNKTCREIGAQSNRLIRTSSSTGCWQWGF